MRTVPHKLLRTKADLAEYIRSLVTDKILWVDTETTSLRTRQAKILIISMYQAGGVPVSVIMKSPYWSGVALEDAIELLDPVFSEYMIGGHNFKYDWQVFYWNGFSFNINLVADTSVLCHLYDPDKPVNLERRLKMDLRIPKKSYEEVVGVKWGTILNNLPKYTSETKTAKGTKPAVVTVENFGYYAVEDVYYLEPFYRHFMALIEDDPKLLNLYNKVEFPLIRTLVKMQIRGITLDKKHLAGLESIIEARVKELIQEAWDVSGYEFNLNSTLQKQDIFYNKLKYPIVKTTNRGEPSTDRKALQTLRDKHDSELAAIIIQYQEVSKLLSTYVHGLPKLVDDDGRIRGNLNSTGTATLRFSSSEPNLQNLADNDVYNIRKAFVADPGWRMIMDDYSAQEYAIAAHASNDENMLKIFETGGDIHQWVADMCQITRKQAKAVGFGIFYGLSIDNLAVLLGVPADVARDYIRRYYGAFPKLKPWKDRVEQFAISKKYIRTPVGSVRRFPTIDFNKAERSSCLRKAVNTCIQGSAAIQVKRAMVLIDQEFERVGLDRDVWDYDAALVLSVHDELGVTAKTYAVERACQIMQYNMENAMPFRAKFSAVPNVVGSYGDGKHDELNERHLFQIDYGQLYTAITYAA